MSRGAIWSAFSVNEAPCPAMAASFYVVHINRDNGAAKGRGDLHGVAADTADAVDDDKVSFCDARLDDRLIRRRHRIGDHGKIG